MVYELQLKIQKETEVDLVRLLLFTDCYLKYTNQIKP